MGLYNIDDSSFYKKLINEYPNYLSDINLFKSLAKNNDMIYYIDDNNKIIYINESKILNKDFMNCTICSLSIVLEDKALYDFVYAIKLYREAQDLYENPSYKLYGNELYKPVAQLLLSTIDHYIQKYAYENQIKNGIKNLIDEIFLNILNNNISINNILSINQVKIVSYYFAKMIYMFDNDGFHKVHSLTNRNCILHNSIIVNNNLEIPEVTEKEALNLIAMFINIITICNSYKANNKDLLNFIQSLV